LKQLLRAYPLNLGEEGEGNNNDHERRNTDPDHAKGGVDGAFLNRKRGKIVSKKRAHRGLREGSSEKGAGKK